MQYQKEVLLKDGTPCVLRGATEKDAAEVLRCFSLTHAETDFLLTYPEENSFTEADEAKFLKAREESENEIEICAFQFYPKQLGISTTNRLERKKSGTAPSSA